MGNCWRDVNCQDQLAWRSGAVAKCLEILEVVPDAETIVCHVTKYRRLLPVIIATKCRDSASARLFVARRKRAKGFRRERGKGVAFVDCRKGLKYEKEIM